MKTVAMLYVLVSLVGIGFFATIIFLTQLIARLPKWCWLRYWWERHIAIDETKR